MSAPAFPPVRGRRPTIEWVPTADLWIDQTYQRSTATPASKKLIRSIAENWNWDLVDVLKVSRRPDDDLYVIDGQHRNVAAVMRGDITDLPCVIKRCSGPLEEAKLFMAANRGRKAMGRLDDFRAAVGAGDAESALIERLVTDAGLKIAAHEMTHNLGPGELTNVGAIRAALKRRGEGVTARALTLIGEAFPDETLMSGGPMFGALVDLIAIDRLDVDRLFEVLLGGTTLQWFNWARLASVGGRGQSRIIALRDTIRERYERGARTAANDPAALAKAV